MIVKKTTASLVTYALQSSAGNGKNHWVPGIYFIQIALQASLVREYYLFSFRR